MTMKNKPYQQRTGRAYMHRQVDVFEYHQRFLIVSEGKKTEPNYFVKFRTPSVLITVNGCGKNTISLIKEAVRLKKEDEYDQTWCVFDRDSFPQDDFNEAINLAQKESIRIAYSNESFELWYILHFDYLTSSLTRDDYITILNSRLGFKYDKNSDKLYEILVSNQGNAISNSKRLLNLYNPPNPVNDNPSTTVHLLVEELNRYSSK